MKNFDLIPQDEESKILTNYIQEKFLIEKIEPIFLMGTILGNEINTYNAKKMYLIKNLVISDNSNNITLPYISFYSKNNVLIFEITNSKIHYFNIINLITIKLRIIDITYFY